MFLMKCYENTTEKRNQFFLSGLERVETEAAQKVASELGFS